jgi:hypothetical protein
VKTVLRLRDLNTTKRAVDYYLQLRAGGKVRCWLESRLKPGLQRRHCANLSRSSHLA